MIIFPRSSYTSTSSNDIDYFKEVSRNQYAIRQIAPRDRRNLRGFYIPRNSLILVEKISEQKFSYRPFYVENKKNRDKLLYMLDRIDFDAMEHESFQALKNILLSFIATHVMRASMKVQTEATYIRIDELYPQAYELFMMNRELLNLDCHVDTNWFGN